MAGLLGKPLLKLVLVGDANAGKTSLLNVFAQHGFSNQYHATVGVDFVTLEDKVAGRNVTLQIWDTAGQERFQSLGVAYYRGASACALVFDITNRASFNNLSKWLRDFHEHTNPPDPDSFPFVVIGNKGDAEPREVEKKEALTWCYNNNNIPYFETSAKQGTDVREAIVELARLALERGVGAVVEEPEGVVDVGNEEEEEEKPQASSGLCWT